MFFMKHIRKDKEGEEIFKELSEMATFDAAEAYKEMNEERKTHYHNYLMWRENTEIVKELAPWVVLGGLCTLVGYSAYRFTKAYTEEEAEDSETPNEEFEN